MNKKSIIVELLNQTCLGYDDSSGLWLKGYEFCSKGYSLATVADSNGFAITKKTDFDKDGREYIIVNKERVYLDMFWYVGG